MVSVKDVALVGGIAVVLFLAIRAGRDLFGALGSIGSVGDINFPEIKFPDIKFPDIKFPDITTTFPEITDQSKGVIEAIQDLADQGGLASLQNEEIIDLLSGLTPLGTPENPANAPTGPTPQDIIVNDPSLSEDQKQDLLTSLTDFSQDPNLNPDLFQDPNKIVDEFQGPNIFPDTGESTFISPDRPLDLFQFAENLGITPAQAFEIQKNQPDKTLEEISGSIFDPVSGQSFEQGGSVQGGGGFTIESNKPLSDVINQFQQDFGIELTASQAANIKAQLDPDPQVENFDFGTNTGSALAILESGISFGGGFSNIELQKAIEAAKAQANEVFGGTSNFANPNFPITLGEAFLGKKGTVVSNSIANLNEEQLQSFVETFGEA